MVLIPIFFCNFATVFDIKSTLFRYMSKQKSMFSFVAEVGNEVVKLIHENEEGHVLILPLRDNVIFPGTINPIIIGRKNSLATIHAAEKKNMLIGIDVGGTKNELVLCDNEGHILNRLLAPGSNASEFGAETASARSSRPASSTLR